MKPWGISSVITYLLLDAIFRCDLERGKGCNSILERTTLPLDILHLFQNYPDLISQFLWLPFPLYKPLSAFTRGWGSDRSPAWGSEKFWTINWTAVNSNYRECEIYTPTGEYIGIDWLANRLEIIPDKHYDLKVNSTHYVFPHYVVLISIGYCVITTPLWIRVCHE